MSLSDRSQRVLVTKFSTLAARVLLLLLVGFGRSAFASADTCRDLFKRVPGNRLATVESLLNPLARQSSLRADKEILEDDDRGAYAVKLYLDAHPHPRVQTALVTLNKLLHISLHRSATGPDASEEIEGLYPTLSSAVIAVPARALASDDALADYLESMIPLTREAAHRWAIEQNQRAVKSVTPAARDLVTNWFEKNLVYVQIKALAGNLGQSTGSTIAVDQAYAKYPRAVGTFAHEIYHSTVTSKLKPNASTTAIGRAIWFQLSSAKLYGEYKKGFRADEYEARLRQSAILRFHKLKADAANIEQDTKLFHEEEVSACELFLALLDQTEVAMGVDAETRMPQFIVRLEGERLIVPKVRDVNEPKAYIREVLKKRLEILVPPKTARR